jgi:hypothetical protein
MERFYSYWCLVEEQALVLDMKFCSRAYLVHDIHEPNHVEMQMHAHINDLQN